MKKRICIFCETWESGGIESFLYNILTHMDLTGLEIDLVASELRGSVFTKGMEDLGVCVVELSGSQKNFLANHGLFRKLLAKRHYDAVHLNVFQGMSLYYAELARRAGIPIRIVHSHNTDIRKSATRSLKLVLHHLYSRCFTKSATDLWACSKAAAEFMFPRAELKYRGYRFVPNGIDVGRFRFRPTVRTRIRKELGLENKLVIGNVGRLCYQKNQVFLLEVLAEVIKTQPNAFLLLVGEGSDRLKLEEKAKALGVREYVIFYGASDHVEELLWAMDVFVFPSRFEGLGIVAIEAQAAGLPVVCSEYVPEEVRVTSSLSVLSLHASPKDWGNQLLAKCTRQNVNDLMARSRFDINDVATQIKKHYVEWC